MTMKIVELSMHMLYPVVSFILFAGLIFTLDHFLYDRIRKRKMDIINELIAEQKEKEIERNSVVPPPIKRKDDKNKKRNF